MPTIENFYWILYQNLLAPVGLDCWYHSPFGTTDNLIRNEFRLQTSRKTNHALFGFDQEPIWGDNFGAYDLQEGAWNNRICKLLANSEVSDFKKKICKQRGMIDWYFFYHGFAALDWFRDAAFIEESATMTKFFSSFNHLTKGQRAYRMALTARLLNLDLAKQGDISFHGNRQGCSEELENHDSLLSSDDKSLIARYLSAKNNLPMILDHHHINGSFSARFGHQEYKLWQRSFLAIVNETVFYPEKLHLTEKVFKPIVCGRPFVLAAAPGNLQYLRSYGFKTFSDWIDESYDQETNNDTRLDMIANEVAKLCGKSFGQILKIHQEMRPILEHNKKHFFGAFREIIANELVDNFDICIRRYNNGLLDASHQLPQVTNPALIKRTLTGQTIFGI